MNHLLHLPTEILLNIYHRLDSVDDVLHFGRSCRRTHNVLNPVGHRLSIFKSIIYSANHHEHDLRLYQFQEAQKRSATVSPEKPYPLSTSANIIPPRTSGSRSVFESYPTNLPDDEVWKIICRWHAMKFLYGLYSDSVIQLCYFFSIPFYSPLDESEEHADTVANEGPLPSPSSFSKENELQLDTAHRKCAYQRFYKALTAHWVAVESLCLVKAANFQTTSQRNRHLNRIWDIWTNNPDRTILEKLDVLEVTDFVWGFLVRKIFQGVDAPWEWLTGGRESLLSYYTDGTYTEQRNWLHFICDVAQYLRPPHIIELLIRAAWNTQSTGGINGPKYLHEVGLFYTGAVQQVDEINQTEDFFPLAALEEDVVNALVGNITSTAQNREICQLRWDQYRCERWVYESRTKILFREETPKQIFNSIMG